MELVFGIGIGFLFGFLVTISCYSEDLSKLKSKAVENHCATYQVVDTLKGTTQFKWNNEKENVK